MVNLESFAQASVSDWYAVHTIGSLNILVPTQGVRVRQKLKMKAQILVMLHTDPLLTFGGTGMQTIMLSIHPKSTPRSQVLDGSKPTHI
jgi:hypothetical protein